MVLSALGPTRPGGLLMPWATFACVCCGEEFGGFSFEGCCFSWWHPGSNCSSPRGGSTSRVSNPSLDSRRGRPSFVSTYSSHTLHFGVCFCIATVPLGPAIVRPIILQLCLVVRPGCCFILGAGPQPKASVPLYIHRKIIGCAPTGHLEKLWPNW